VGRQIPVVTVGTESRADSTPIGLWLDELFPDHPPLLPSDGEERERLMAIDTWVSNHLIPGSFRSYPGEGIDRILNGWKLYDEFLAHLGEGPFLGGRDAPSLPDLSAYPQFALYYVTGFRGGDDILDRPELMKWMGRMRPYVEGKPPLMPAVVRKKDLPGTMATRNRAK
jgi:glutathione S-transferase